MKKKLLITLLLIIITFAISMIPYEAARMTSPPDHHFLGQVMNLDDHNMYFSFIRQAYDGKVLFNNRLTGNPNGGVFFNIQFLTVGLLMRVFHLSEYGVYQLWRLSGAVFLIGGFAFLSTIFIKSMRRWLLSMLLFCLGGGFGIISIAAFQAGLISKEWMNVLSYDVWGGVQPFQQIVSNPNFSLPHGLMLIGFALYLIAEKNKDRKFYLYSAVIFTLDGFIRPYDLFSVFAIFPSFVLIESLLTGFDLKKSLYRLLPLFLSIPALAYSAWLFKINETFRWWSMQGHNIKSLPEPWWHLLAFGPAIILALPRLFHIKKQPLSSEERFLCLWFVVIFGLEYIGWVIPAIGFSPQIGVPLVSPLILIGFLIKSRRFAFFNLEHKTHRNLLTGVILALVILGNSGVTAYYSMRFILRVNTNRFYACKDEVNAWNWIKNNLQKETAILALPSSSNRLAKFTSECTVVGHYSVSPHYKENEKKVTGFFSPGTHPEEKKEIVKKLNVQYVFFGPEERNLWGTSICEPDWMKKIYDNGSVSIYNILN